MKNKTMHFTGILFAILFGTFYAMEFFAITNDFYERPYIYRYLLQHFSYGLSYLGFPLIYSIKIVLVISSVILYESLHYLYISISIDDYKAHIYSVIAFSLIVFMAMFPSHIYDLATAITFSLSFAFIYKKRLLAFLLLFPITAMNRETSLFLIPIFIIYNLNRMPLKKLILISLLCLVEWVAIRYSIMYIFRDYSGFDSKLFLERNLNIYIDNPYLVLQTILMVLAIIGMVHARWKTTPSLFRISLLVMAPILFILYHVVGIILEYRVFIEIIPILVFIGIYDGK